MISKIHLSVHVLNTGIICVIILPSFSFHDVYEVEDVYNTIIDILETHKVNRYKIAECYHAIGIAYYNLEFYEESIENLLISYKYDKEHFKPLYVYIAHAQYTHTKV